MSFSYPEGEGITEKQVNQGGEYLEKKEEIEKYKNEYDFMNVDKITTKNQHQVLSDAFPDHCDSDIHDKSSIPESPIVDKLERSNAFNTFNNAADLLTPFYMALESDHKTCEDKSKRMKMVPMSETPKCYFKSYNNIGFSGSMLPPYSLSEPSRGYSVIRLHNNVPEVVFTTEELCVLRDQELVQKSNLLNTARKDLFEARVKNYFGQLSHEGMLMVVASGRKAQNYYHYLTMSSLPFFQDLSER